VFPQVEVTPSIVTMMKGSDVKAVCQASGYPAPGILWRLDAVMLSTSYEVSPHHSLVLWFIGGFTYRSQIGVLI
jgi:hypothetical protein